MVLTIGHRNMSSCHRLALGALLASCLSFATPAFAQESTGGEWQAKSQLVWDQDAKKLVRKNFRVRDPHPELGLEFSWEQFSWEQQSGAAPDPDGAVNGSGRLTWRQRGSAPYDRKAIYSEYRGDMRNGRPHGAGALTVRSGLSYQGSWKDGLMDGRGAIKFANGDEYQGDFAAGTPHGEGRYAAADGSIFEGAFRNGERHGAGTLILPDGVAYRTLWERGTETQRSRVAGAEQLAPDQDKTGEVQIAQAPPRITLKAYTDRQRNNQFIRGDADFRSYIYDQETTPGLIRIRLASREIMDAWKGSAMLPETFKLFEEVSQFAPVLLVVEVANEGAQAIQFVGGYLDVAESSTDLQPYLNFSQPLPFHGCGEGDFNPQFGFTNFGWGSVKGARVNYGFGRGPDADANFVFDLGSFDESTKMSALDGLLRSGVNVPRLINKGFKCPSRAQLPACTSQLLSSGVLGRVGGDSIVRRETTLLVRTSGRIHYNWTDANGATRARQSPFSVDLPLLKFEVGEAAECGGASPVERDLKPIKLPLDRKSYRIPLGYRGTLAPRQGRRFGLTLSADKSSQHMFKIVLQLADGQTIATPNFDLLYFLPRIPANFQPLDLEEKNPPGPN